MRLFNRIQDIGPSEPLTNLSLSFVDAAWQHGRMEHFGFWIWIKPNFSIMSNKWKKLLSVLTRANEKQQSIVDCSDFIRQRCKDNVGNCVNIWYKGE